MSTKRTINEAAAVHLGGEGTYAVTTTQFDATLLVKMPREEARKQWNIQKEAFIGIDVWRAYESTFLLNNGAPVSGTLKIVYDCHSEYMVESKSLKLYLNTFDMCKMGSSIAEGIKQYTLQVKRDLSKLLETEVSVGFFSESNNTYIDHLAIGFPSEAFDLIDHYAENSSTYIDDYNERGVYIRFSDKSYNETVQPFKEGQMYGREYYRSNILRSRCRHTKQKDSGSAYVFIRAKRRLEPGSLFNQIASIREVNEFHEFCAEKLFHSMNDTSSFEKDPEIKDLMVGCLYARRGGIDINPIRATSWDLIPSDFIDINRLCIKTIMQ